MKTQDPKEIAECFAIFEMEQREEYMDHLRACAASQFGLPVKPEQKTRSTAQEIIAMAALQTEEEK